MRLKAAKFSIPAMLIVLTEGVSAEEFTCLICGSILREKGVILHQFLTEGQYLSISQQDFIDYGLSTDGQLNCYVNGVYNNSYPYDSVTVNATEISNTAPYFTNDISLEPNDGITLIKLYIVSVQAQDDEQEGLWSSILAMTNKEMMFMKDKNYHLQF